jgi:dihydrofolate reductase
MFYGRAEQYLIEKPILVEDDFNHARTTYESRGNAQISIVIQDRTNLNANDLLLYKATVVGYTLNKDIEKDWRIGGKYLVRSTLPHKLGKVLYLEEISDGR